MFLVMEHAGTGSVLPARGLSSSRLVLSLSRLVLSLQPRAEQAGGAGGAGQECQEGDVE